MLINFFRRLLNVFLSWFNLISLIYVVRNFESNYENHNKHYKRLTGHKICVA